MSKSKKNSKNKSNPKVTPPQAVQLPPHLGTRVTCGKKDSGDALKSIKHIKGKE